MASTAYEEEDWETEIEKLELERKKKAGAHSNGPASGKQQHGSTNFKHRQMNGDVSALKGKGRQETLELLRRKENERNREEQKEIEAQKVREGTHLVSSEVLTNGSSSGCRPKNGNQPKASIPKDIPWARADETETQTSVLVENVWEKRSGRMLFNQCGKDQEEDPLILQAIRLSEQTLIEDEKRRFEKLTRGRREFKAVDSRETPHTAPSQSMDFQEVLQNAPFQPVKSPFKEDPHISPVELVLSTKPLVKPKDVNLPSKEGREGSEGKGKERDKNHKLTLPDDMDLWDQDELVFSNPVKPIEIPGQEDESELVAGLSFLQESMLADFPADEFPPIPLPDLHLNSSSPDPKVVFLGRNEKDCSVVDIPQEESIPTVSVPQVTSSIEPVGGSPISTVNKAPPPGFPPQVSTAQPFISFQNIYEGNLLPPAMITQQYLIHPNPAQMGMLYSPPFYLSQIQSPLAVSSATMMPQSLTSPASPVFNPYLPSSFPTHIPPPSMTYSTYSYANTMPYIVEAEAPGVLYSGNGEARMPLDDMAQMGRGRGRARGKLVNSAQPMPGEFFIPHMNQGRKLSTYEIPPRHRSRDFNGGSGYYGAPKQQ
ncbi:unnamed protein product [Darwinula stevensoni]|uniref:Uncharacterized protein n=1 Tax=Darwinula stevensoni TaxID=69355 RepID=A0A7R8WXL6_9CRUS|nr:unnamed protein product [Darwinula stevensoni]CAG0878573.1 unnamed protein product [Darwinula stevensoni]